MLNINNENQIISNIFTNDNPRKPNNHLKKYHSVISIQFNTDIVKSHIEVSIYNA